MKKTVKTIITKFGRIVEEIPAYKLDCGMIHIYLNNLTDDTLLSLKEYVGKFFGEKIPSCIIHWDDRVETLCNFGEEYFIY